MQHGSVMRTHHVPAKPVVETVPNDLVDHLIHPGKALARYKAAGRAIAQHAVADYLPEQVEIPSFALAQDRLRHHTGCHSIQQLRKPAVAGSNPHRTLKHIDQRPDRKKRLGKICYRMARFAVEEAGWLFNS
jgi:hypothetical protein